jgi:hypothetical protein
MRTAHLITLVLLAGFSDAFQVASRAKHASKGRPAARTQPLVVLAATADAVESKDDKNKGRDNRGQKVPLATFNLIKAAVGSGVLALPSGLAAMSDVPSAYVEQIACSS